MNGSTSLVGFLATMSPNAPTLLTDREVWCVLSLKSSDAKQRTTFPAAHVSFKDRDSQALLTKFQVEKVKHPADRCQTTKNIILVLTVHPPDQKPRDILNCGTSSTFH